MRKTHMEILGRIYSDRVDSLYETLRSLAGESPVFDHDIDLENCFAVIDGQYHGNSHPPRVSLISEPDEETVAHELLHGILEYLKYPGWCESLRTYFTFPTAIAKEAAHCVLHNVIDTALLRLGYAVQESKADKAKKRTAFLAEMKPSPADDNAEAWWSIRIAFEAAYHTAILPIDEQNKNAFRDQAFLKYPTSKTLTEKCVGIVAGMDVKDRPGVHRTICDLLRACQDEPACHGFCQDMGKRTIIAPQYFTRRQLDAPARQAVTMEEWQSTVPGHKILALLRLPDQRLISLADCDGAADFRRESKYTKAALRGSLRGLLDHIDRKMYYQIDSRNAQESVGKITSLLG